MILYTCPAYAVSKDRRRKSHRLNIVFDCAFTRKSHEMETTWSGEFPRRSREPLSPRRQGLQLTSLTNPSPPCRNSFPLTPCTTVSFLCSVPSICCNVSAGVQVPAATIPSAPPIGRPPPIPHHRATTSEVTELEEQRGAMGLGNSGSVLL